MSQNISKCLLSYQCGEDIIQVKGERRLQIHREVLKEEDWYSDFKNSIRQKREKRR